MKTLTSNRLSKVTVISLSLWVCFALYTCSNNRIGTQVSRVRYVPQSEDNRAIYDNNFLYADYDSTDIFSHKLSSL